MGFRDHFSTQSRQYADYRPSYPFELTKCLARLAPGRRLAWDCATGQGQAARLLVEDFQRVWATDASARQLDMAAPHPRIDFFVAEAAASGLSDASVDLVTVAQAAHWFDLPPFYAEVRRVLRPNGILAIWGYGSCTLNDPTIARLVQRFEYDRMGPYWPEGRELIVAGYETLPFPFQRVATPPFELTAKWTREAFLGYVSSWSAVARYKEAHQDDPVADFEFELVQVWPDNYVMTVRWPMPLLVGRV